MMPFFSFIFVCFVYKFLLNVFCQNYFCFFFPPLLLIIFDWKTDIPRVTNAKLPYNPWLWTNTWKTYHIKYLKKKRGSTFLLASKQQVSTAAHWFVYVFFFLSLERYTVHFITDVRYKLYRTVVRGTYKFHLQTLSNCCERNIQISLTHIFWKGTHLLTQGLPVDLWWYVVLCWHEMFTSDVLMILFFISNLEQTKLQIYINSTEEDQSPSELTNN